MALVSCYIPLASSLPSPLAVSATPISRVLIKPLISFPQKHCISTTVIVTKRSSSRLRIGAASDAVNGTVGEAGSGGEVGPVTKEEAVVGVDKLPLESKLQERSDQKLKMKMAKKIRLRRKRLVRKRKLRKKGRWPPSKMKKLKNV